MGFFLDIVPFHNGVTCIRLPTLVQVCSRTLIKFTYKMSCFAVNIYKSYWRFVSIKPSVQSSILDWEVRRLGMRDTLKHGTITVSGFGYFQKNCRFLWGKNVSKKNLGSTIHYTYTSYNKYFRLCMASEELRLNEIGLFL